MPKIGDRVLPSSIWESAGKGTLVGLSPHHNHRGTPVWVIMFDKPLSEVDRRVTRARPGTNNALFSEDNFTVLENERTFGAWARKMEGRDA